MAKAGKIRIKIEDRATKSLEAVRLTLRSPKVTVEVQRGAEIMAHAVRQRAPVRTGALKKGVYTASALKNGKPGITRKHGRSSQVVVPDLRFPPRKGQVLVVSGAFYGRWVEEGRKKRAAVSEASAKSKRRSSGRVRKRPFFRPGIRASRSSAESYIRRRIERIIQESAK